MDVAVEWPKKPDRSIGQANIEAAFSKLNQIPHLTEVGAMIPAIRDATAVV